jgi:penicillin-binding protein 2
MVDVTHPGGTAARAAKGAPYAFAGKTGTAQVVALRPEGHRDGHKVDARHRDHAVFIAYAPADNPTIALAVLVEHGGEGGSTAAPIARKVLDYYLLGKKPTPLEATAADDHESGD